MVEKTYQIAPYFGAFEAYLGVGKPPFFKTSQAQVKSQSKKFGQVKPQVKSEGQKFGQVKSQGQNIFK